MYKTTIKQSEFIHYKKQNVNYFQRFRKLSATYLYPKLFINKKGIWKYIKFKKIDMRKNVKNLTF